MELEPEFTDFSRAASPASREAISLSLIPGEAGVVAILGAITAVSNMIGESLRRDAVVRVTMDKELLKRHDEIQVKNLERGERFLSFFEGLLPK